MESTCTRIALEWTRALAWQTTGTLRKEVAAMLASGSSAMQVQAQLDVLLSDALKAQGAGLR